MPRPKGSKNKETSSEPIMSAVAVFRKSNGYYAMVNLKIQGNKVIEKEIRQESTQSDFFSRLIIKFQDVVRKLNKTENKYGSEYFA